MKLFLPLLVLGLACLNACTQDEAEVAYKGDEYYGRTHQGALDSPDHETYPENSPRIKPGYSRPAEDAALESVGVSDLPPPPMPGTQTTAAPITVSQSGIPFGLPSKESESVQPGQPPAIPGSQPTQPTQPAQADAKPAIASSRFIWPVAAGKLIAHFGPKAGGRSNDGVNIAVAEGEPICASADGTVVYSGSDLKGYGNMVILRHDSGFMTAYAHARSLSVKKGDTVKQGDVIAYVGQTGGVKTPQVHFAIRQGRTPVDPELYLPKNVLG